MPQLCQCVTQGEQNSGEGQQREDLRIMYTHTRYRMHTEQMREMRCALPIGNWTNKKIPSSPPFCLRPLLCDLSHIMRLRFPPSSIRQSVERAAKGTSVSHSIIRHFHNECNLRHRRRRAAPKRARLHLHPRPLIKF